MVARGYDGTVRLAKPLQWTRNDTLFLVLTAVYLAVVYWGAISGAMIRGTA
jgi:energy-coupling factor transporter transmembrane protein EcfT